MRFRGMSFSNREIMSSSELSVPYQQTIESLTETFLDPGRHCVVFLRGGNLDPGDRKF